MHIATHPARPVKVQLHCSCEECPPPAEQFAGAHHSDPDVFLLGRVRPHVEMTAARAAWPLELARLMGRAR